MEQAICVKMPIQRRENNKLMSEQIVVHLCKLNVCNRQSMRPMQKSFNHRSLLWLSFFIDKRCASNRFDKMENNQFSVHRQNKIGRLTDVRIAYALHVRQSNNMRTVCLAHDVKYQYHIILRPRINRQYNNNLITCSSMHYLFIYLFFYGRDTCMCSPHSTAYSRLLLLWYYF